MFKLLPKLKLYLWLSTLLFITFTHSAIADVPVSKPIAAVASFSIVADLVKQVGGEHVQLTTLIPANTDAHSFEPSAKDAQALSKAQLLFINGLGFEPWIERLQKASGFSGKIIVVSEGVQAIAFHDGDDEDHHSHDGHNHGEFDPHAWQDVKNVILYVENIEKALSQADPAHAVDYKVNAQTYIKQLQALDAEIIASISQIPQRHRVLVSSHNSFAYFAKRYGFKTFSPLGMSDEALPSARTIAHLITEVRALQIPALFVENTGNPKVIEQVSRETKIPIGGKLYTDALMVKGTPADNYIGMMRENIKILTNALK